VNALQKTLAIVALLTLVSQTVRHAYRLWLEPRGSVLDKYDQPLKDEISAANSLQELLNRYDQVRKEADEKRQERLREGKKDISYVEELQTEPYKSEHALRDAITDWEKKSAEIRELRFYWLAGFVFFVLGLFTYRKFSRWFGLSLLIVAFSELIYWTSPTLFGPGTREYDRLLLNKLVFSAVSLVLLLAVIWISRMFAEKERSKSQAYGLA
jgi:hypothetical protein